MTKPLTKTLSKTATIFLFVSFLMIISMMTFIHPAKFKQGIQKQILAATDQTVDFKGPIHWNLLKFCLEAHEVVIPSRTPFSKDLLSIKTLRFTPHLLPFLFGKAVFDIEAYDATLNLQRLSSGYNNWEALLSKWSNDSDPILKSQGLFLTQIQLHNGTIQFQDDQSNQQYSLQSIDLLVPSLASSLVGNSKQLSLSCIFEDANASAKIQLQTKGIISVKNDFQTLSVQDLDIQLSSGGPPCPPNGPLSPPNGSPVSNNAGHAPTKIKGAFEVTALKTEPKLQGDFSATDLQLKPWLQYAKLPFASQCPEIQALKVTMNYQDGVLNLPAFLLKIRDLGTIEGHLSGGIGLNGHPLKLEGKLFAKALTWGNLPIHQFEAKTLFQNGLLDFSNLSFQTAEGKHEGAFSVDVRTDIPKLTLSYSFDAVEMNTILKSFGLNNTLTGKARAKTYLSSYGATGEDLRRNLAGQAEMEISEGALYGIDLLYLLKHAQSTLKTLITGQKENIKISEVLKQEFKEWKKQADSLHPFFTPFETAKASALISNGVLSNPDLSIQHAKYTIEGKGTLDLVQDSIQFKTILRYKEISSELKEDIASFLRDAPLNIHIQGALKNPSIRPDLEGYTQYGLQFSQKNMFEKFVDKNIDNLMEAP